MINNTLREQLTTLRLHGMLEALEAMSETESEPPHWETALSRLLTQEANHRQSRSFLYRLELAKFPQIKTLDSFDISHSPITKTQLDKLSHCNFIPAHENIFLIGGSGTGKTHLALGIAHQALHANYRVRFIRFNELAKQLLLALTHHCEMAFIAKLQRFHLLIIDELGYQPIEPSAGGLLFELFAGLYEKNSLIITSHLTFDEWPDLFGNKQATQAMLDRLTHHSHLLETSNQSWRFKEIKDKQKEQNIISNKAVDENNSPIKDQQNCTDI